MAGCCTELEFDEDVLCALLQTFPDTAATVGTTFYGTTGNTCGRFELPVSTFTDNGDGSFTHTNGLGVAVTIAICDLINNIAVGDSATGDLTLRIGADGACKLVAGGGNSTIVDNGDASFTHTSGDGTVVTVPICDLLDDIPAGVTVLDDVTVTIGADGVCKLVPAVAGGNSTIVDNGDASFTHTSGAGVVTVIPVCDLLDDIPAGVVVAGDATVTIGADGICKLVPPVVAGGDVTPAGEVYPVDGANQSIIGIRYNDAAGAFPVEFDAATGEWEICSPAGGGVVGKASTFAADWPCADTNGAPIYQTADGLRGEPPHVTEAFDAPGAGNTGTQQTGIGNMNGTFPFAPVPIVIDADPCRAITAMVDTKLTIIHNINSGDPNTAVRAQGTVFLETSIDGGATWVGHDAGSFASNIGPSVGLANGTIGSFDLNARIPVNIPAGGAAVTVLTRANILILAVDAGSANSIAVVNTVFHEVTATRATT